VELVSEIGAERDRSAKTMFAWISVGLLLVGLVAPIAQIPILGTVNVFNAQDGTAYWFLGFAALGAAATFFKSYRLLALPGVLVVATTLYYVYHFFKIKADMAASLRGNPFAALATGLAGTFQLQWGVAVLITAGIALIVAALVRHDAASITKLFAGNKHLFLEGFAALCAIFVTIALMPGFLSLLSGGATSTSVESATNNPFNALTRSNDAATPAPDPKIAEMRNIVSVGVLEKGFHEADPSNNDYRDAFTVKLQYHNLSRKSVSGFKGSLRFYDQFSTLVQSFRVEYQNDMRPGAVVVEDDRYHYNQFESSDTKLREIPLAKLHVVWEPSRINYADGSTNATND
jgi:hypothetical protein